MALFFAELYGQRDISRVILHVDSKYNVRFIDFFSFTVIRQSFCLMSVKLCVFSIFKLKFEFLVKFYPKIYISSNTGAIFGMKIEPSKMTIRTFLRSSKLRSIGVFSECCSGCQVDISLTTEHDLGSKFLKEFIFEL